MIVSRRNPVSTNQCSQNKNFLFFFFHHNEYQELTLNGGTVSPSTTFQNNEEPFSMEYSVLSGGHRTHLAIFGRVEHPCALQPSDAAC